jgi:hypothetical protein
LARALPGLLRDGAPTIFSLVHPCFNSAPVALVAETEDLEGEIRTTYYIKMGHYATPLTIAQAALRDQPEPHLVFHRSLQEILGAAFAGGFVVDGLLEPTFSPDAIGPDKTPTWDGRMAGIPPVLVVRLARTARAPK